MQSLREEDEVISVRLTSGDKDIIVGTSNGMLIRFNEQDVRSMGRNAAGVKAITLGEEDRVVGMEIVEEDVNVLIVTKNGYGKRTPIDEYRLQSRGGKGLKTCNITDKNGKLVAVKSVTGEEDIMLITAAGVIIRMPVDRISQMGRNTQGVRLIRLEDEQEVATVAKAQKDDEEETSEEVSSEE